ncbi:MAG: MurR/RpiR family transcriptional regulator [Gammaproteobacteria bacterium]|nr:MurR/RpiR family transcriptional regulator [Gammaproteobacteria bacterium]
MSEYAQVHDKLKASMLHLPKTLKKAAAYMLERPGDIATLSMRQVAANADVSLPNFARLAKELGYETYGEMREIFRKQVQQGDITGYHLRARNLQQSSHHEGIEKTWGNFRESARTTIDGVYTSIDASQIAAVADALVPRRNIYVVGMKAARSAASYLSYIGGMASEQFKLVGRSGDILADDLIDIDERDALIAIAAHPYARATIETAMVARERGALVVGITDGPVSPLAISSDHVLLSPTGSPMFFESYIGTTAIIEMLIGFFTVIHSTSAVSRIEKLEADRHRFGEYWES